METIIYSIYDKDDNFIDAQCFETIENARKWRNDMSKKINTWIYGIIN